MADKGYDIEGFAGKLPSGESKFQITGRAERLVKIVKPDDPLVEIVPPEPLVEIVKPTEDSSKGVGNEGSKFSAYTRKFMGKK